jgi:hypothetical protein
MCRRLMTLLTNATMSSQRSRFFVRIIIQILYRTYMAVCRPGSPGFPSLRCRVTYLVHPLIISVRSIGHRRSRAMSTTRGLSYYDCCARRLAVKVIIRIMDRIDYCGPSLPRTERQRLLSSRHASALTGWTTEVIRNVIFIFLRVIVLRLQLS